MHTQYFERPEGTLAYSDYGGNGQLVLMLPGMGHFVGNIVFSRRNSARQTITLSPWICADSANRAFRGETMTYHLSVVISLL